MEGEGPDEIMPDDYNCPFMLREPRLPSLSSFPRRFHTLARRLAGPECILPGVQNLTSFFSFDDMHLRKKMNKDV